MTITPQIIVHAQADYLLDESSPDNQHFLWSYEVTIDNQSEHMIQLLSRHWKITDLAGRVEDVRGLGVIGLQPIIKPGKRFSYSSFCQLQTPQGVMEGSYEMQTLEEYHFSVKIPKFILACPPAMMDAFRSLLH